MIIILFGLAWGSFLNVVIYRLPRRISLLSPPSSCPFCHKRIKFYDNIPLLSFLILRGKCRHCGKRISLTYLLVELITPLSFLLLYSQYSLHLHFFASCLFISALIVLSFIDFYHKLLPDKITLPMLSLSLVYSFFREDIKFLQALLGAAVGAGFLLGVYGAYYWLRKKEGLGLGDVTMMLMVGAYLGWVRTLITLILASLAGALVGMFFIVFRKKGLQYSLPYGSFLAPAAFVSLLWGEVILTAYLSLFKNF
ncbi:MAG: prepilin peptidase [Candidatus Aminicenantales bacterium]